MLGRAYGFFTVSAGHGVVIEGEVIGFVGIAVLPMFLNFSTPFFLSHEYEASLANRTR